MSFVSDGEINNIPAMVQIKPLFETNDWWLVYTRPQWVNSQPLPPPHHPLIHHPTTHHQPSTTTTPNYPPPPTHTSTHNPNPRPIPQSQYGGGNYISYVII